MKETTISQKLFIKKNWNLEFSGRKYIRKVPSQQMYLHFSYKLALFTVVGLLILSGSVIKQIFYFSINHQPQKTVIFYFKIYLTPISSNKLIIIYFLIRFLRHLWALYIIRMLFNSFFVFSTVYFFSIQNNPTHY